MTYGQKLAIELSNNAILLADEVAARMQSGRDTLSRQSFSELLKLKSFAEVVKSTIVGEQ